MIPALPHSHGPHSPNEMTPDEDRRAWEMFQDGFDLWQIRDRYDVTMKTVKQAIARHERRLTPATTKERA